MRFIDLKQFGEPGVMVLSECEAPKPGAGEVLIKVSAAGINRPDIAQRRGVYPPPPDASPILGLEVAGEIVEVGEGVANNLVGNSVCALCNGGGYAEVVAVPAGQCLPIPQGFSMVEAAAIPETFFTVWTNVFDRANLQAGESILIHGGSSGIGTTAIQLAKAFGATVYTTVGNEEKRQYCLALGADAAINYKTDDFVTVLQEMTEKRGVDVILDMVGGEYVMRNIQLAATDGRIVNIAFLGGAEVTVNLAVAMVKRITLTGSTLRPRSREVKADIANSLRHKVWPLLEQGKVKPRIAKVFALDQIVAAHQLMESSQHMGKIVVEL